MTSELLIDFLKNNVKKFDIAKESDKPGVIYGIYKRNHVLIQFKTNEWLNIVSKNEKVKELIPVLNSVMENQIPICDFNMVYDSGEVYYAVEWDLINPKERLNDIVNNRDHKHVKYENVNVYNGSIDKILRVIENERVK